MNSYNPDQIIVDTTGELSLPQPCHVHRAVLIVGEKGPGAVKVVGANGVTVHVACPSSNDSRVFDYSHLPIRLTSPLTVQVSGQATAYLRYQWSQ